MLWLIQNNFMNEDGYARLVDALERLELPHQIVKPVPGTDFILPGDLDTSKATKYVHELPQAEIDESQKIITSGSYTLARTAVKRGWNPGAYINNLDYQTYSKGWPAELLLNPGAKVCAMKDASFDDEAAFIKPDQDSKAFAGKVFGKAEFDDFKGRIVKQSEKDLFNGETLVVISKPIEIWVEARLFVVDGKIVTASIYKRGRRVVYQADVDDETLGFGRKCLEVWQPSKAFVLDVAETALGRKIVEVNCINAAGLYACDPLKIIAALEELNE